MILDIFDVEHGACALITTSNGRRMMIDCGHNTTTGWRPGTSLRRSGITHLDRLIVTNYDEDHVSGLPNLIDNIDIDELGRNPSVRPDTIRFLKSEDGMGDGINVLVRSIENVFTGGSPTKAKDFGDTSFSFFWNNHGSPPLGFDDENNLGLVVFVKCGDHKIIFPGDMEKAGWRRLLQKPEFVNELSNVNVFVASHHGRENGCCEEVLQHCRNVFAFVISDQKKRYQTQETVEQYRRYAKGVSFPNGTLRRVLTTRRDSSMRFQMPVFGQAVVYLNVLAMPVAA